MVGLEDVPGGEVFLRAMMLLPVPAEEKPVAPGAKAYLRTKSAQIPEEWKERWAKAIDLVATAWEGIFQKTAAALFRKEKDELLKILRREGKASVKAAPFDTFLQAGAIYLLMSRDGWIEEFGPLFAGLLTAQADNILGAYGISFDIARPEVQEFLENYTMKFAQGLFENSEEKLRTLIMQAQSEGWSVPKTRDAISELWDGFDKNRAEMIARTETLRSSNYGAVEAWAQAGIEKKEWYTTIDGRQCGWCESMHETVVSIRSNFKELGDELDATDEEGRTQIWRVEYEAPYAPPLHPRCRCSVLAHFE